MHITNKSKRPYTIGGKVIPPDQTVEVENVSEHDLKGLENDLVEGKASKNADEVKKDELDQKGKRVQRQD